MTNDDRQNIIIVFGTVGLVISVNLIYSPPQVRFLPVLLQGEFEMNSFWNLLDELARLSILIMLWYIGGFILGSGIIYLFHSLGIL